MTFKLSLPPKRAIGYDLLLCWLAICSPFSCFQEKPLWIIEVQQFSCSLYATLEFRAEFRSKRWVLRLLSKFYMKLHSKLGGVNETNYFVQIGLNAGHSPGKNRINNWCCNRQDLKKRVVLHWASFGYCGGHFLALANWNFLAETGQKSNVFIKLAFVCKFFWIRNSLP